MHSERKKVVLLLTPVTHVHKDIPGFSFSRISTHTIHVFDREIRSDRGLKNWFVIVVVVVVLLGKQLSIFDGFRRYWSLIVFLLCQMI